MPFFIAYQELFESFLTFSLNFLLQVIHQKYRISYDEITNDLCPVSYLFLSLTQSACMLVSYICASFWSFLHVIWELAVNFCLNLSIVFSENPCL